MNGTQFLRASLISLAAATLAGGLLLLAPPATCGCGREERAAEPEATEAPRARAAQQPAVAIIVNKSNPVESLTLGELREFFLAERSHWPTKQRVRVAMVAAGRPERQVLLRTVCNMSREQDFQAYFLRAKFSEQTLEQPREFNSAPDVIRFISNIPGAIGFVRADEVDPSVKVIRVEDLTPGDPGYKLSF
jgi:ABC-type phosphate transport system substrate-binding protein